MPKKPKPTSSHETALRFVRTACREGAKHISERSRRHPIQIAQMILREAQSHLNLEAHVETSNIREANRLRRGGTAP